MSREDERLLEKEKDVQTQMYCAACNQTVDANVEYVNGKLTYILMGVLFCLCICVFWVPLFVNRCKDISYKWFVTIAILSALIN